MRMNSVKALLLGAVLLAAGTASAATDMFMKIEKTIGGAVVEGESNDSNHAKQIEIISMNWEATNTVAISRTGGAGAGKVSFSDLSFSKKVDKASGPLMQASAAGTRFEKVTIEFVKPGPTPGAKVLPYLVIELKDVFVSSYSIASSDDVPEETVSFVFAAYRQTYTPLKADGKPDTAVVGQWNVATNTAVFGASKDGVPAVSEPPVASGTKVSVEQP